MSVCVRVCVFVWIIVAYYVCVYMCEWYIVHVYVKEHAQGLFLPDVSYHCI